MNEPHRTAHSEKKVVHRLMGCRKICYRLWRAWCGCLSFWMIWSVMQTTWRRYELNADGCGYTFDSLRHNIFERISCLFCVGSFDFDAFLDFLCAPFSPWMHRQVCNGKVFAFNRLHVSSMELFTSFRILFKTLNRIVRICRVVHFISWIWTIRLATIAPCPMLACWWPDWSCIYASFV